MLKDHVIKNGIIRVTLHSVRNYIYYAEYMKEALNTDFLINDTEDNVFYLLNFNSNIHVSTIVELCSTEGFEFVDFVPIYNNLYRNPEEERVFIGALLIDPNKKYKLPMLKDGHYI